ncbi:GNAT family N-acetyltransferase [Oceanobacillus sp. 1P07AA]|uniref:GNAT family N-acetyltransferase n=1 Tax=Oceanobacillus sp. 1P07AA TaxID=3132293 RepID=UPI0039A685DC
MRACVLQTRDYEQMKKLFLDVFSSEPWFDKWDEKQLDLYMKDLTENNNSLSIAMYDEKEELIGCSLGYVFNWWEGREYYIKEFFISTNIQGQGKGSTFLNLMEGMLKDRDIKHILLSTEKTVPAYQFYKKNKFTVLNDSVFLVKKIPE